MSKTYNAFMNESSSAEKRSLTRSVQRKLPKEFTFGGAMSLIAMADEDVMSVSDVAKAISDIAGMGKFKEAKLAGGLKASYGSGIVSVITSAGKVRVEFS